MITYITGLSPLSHLDSIIKSKVIKVTIQLHPKFFFFGLSLNTSDILKGQCFWSLTTLIISALIYNYKTSNNI